MAGKGTRLGLLPGPSLTQPIKEPADSGYQSDRNARLVSPPVAFAGGFQGAHKLVNEIREESEYHVTRIGVRGVRQSLRIHPCQSVSQKLPITTQTQHTD
ncbi:hypothetical protein Pcinc_041084 [Petrolisthes cinctipes]|uniref:Uncharacterized protein n=1 Tax=Petrolisthes cinctipes TaxID=88211 RepID=A0AAE1BK88_PETCI|nr:hypothetical protein Pcinc_041084 [Petrolisthes cinctipes]